MEFKLATILRGIRVYNLTKFSLIEMNIRYEIGVKPSRARGMLAYENNSEQILFC